MPVASWVSCLFQLVQISPHIRQTFWVCSQITDLPFWLDLAWNHLLFTINLNVHFPCCWLVGFTHHGECTVPRQIRGHCAIVSVPTATLFSMSFFRIED
jgi:hypothetical protein